MGWLGRRGDDHFPKHNNDKQGNGNNHFNKG
jgi:hypothetical protein